MTDRFWDGHSLIAACCGSTVKAWNPFNNAEHVIKDEQNVLTLQWNNNGKVLAYAGEKGTISLYTNGGYLGGLPSADSKGEVMDTVLSMRFTRDSRKLVTGCKNRALHVWDLKTQTCVKVNLDHKSAVQSVCPSPDGDLLASSSAAGEILLHNLQTGYRLLQLPTEDSHSKRSLAFCALEATALAAASEDGSILVWSIKSRMLQTNYKQKHAGGRATGVAFAVNNPNLLYSCGTDKKLFILDRRNTQQEAQVVVASAPLSCLGCREDGITIAAGTAGGSLLVYDTRNMSAPIAETYCGEAAPVTECHWQRVPASAASSAAPRAAAPVVQPAAPVVAAPLPVAASAAATPVSQAAQPAKKVGHDSPLVVSPVQAGLSDGASSVTTDTFASAQPNTPGTSSQAPLTPPSVSSKAGLLAAATAAAAAAAKPAAALPGQKASAQAGPLQQQPLASTSTAQHRPSAGITGASATAVAGKPTALSNGGSNGISAAAAPSSAATARAPPPQATAAAPVTSTGTAPASGTEPAAAVSTSRPSAASKPAPPAASAAATQPAPPPASAAPRSTAAAQPSTEQPAAAARAAAATKPAAAAAWQPPDARAMTSAPAQGRPVTEEVFKAYVDKAVSVVREDVRNLHIELLRQFHVQQLEMNQLVDSVGMRQLQLSEQVARLQQQLERMLQRQDNIGWP